MCYHKSAIPLKMYKFLGISNWLDAFSQTTPLELSNQFIDILSGKRCLVGEIQPYIYKLTKNF